MVHHRIYSFFIFDLDLGVTQNIAQYPLHHVTYAPAKFEVTMSNGLGEDKFKRNYINWPLTLASRSYAILPSTLYIMRPMHLQRLKLLLKEQMHLQENTIFDLGLGIKATQDVAMHLYIMWHMHLQSLLLLRFYG